MRRSAPNPANDRLSLRVLVPKFHQTRLFPTSSTTTLSFPIHPKRVRGPVLRHDDGMEVAGSDERGFEPVEGVYDAERGRGPWWGAGRLGEAALAEAVVAEGEDGGRGEEDEVGGAGGDGEDGALWGCLVGVYWEVGS